MSEVRRSNATEDESKDPEDVSRTMLIQGVLPMLCPRKRISRPQVSARSFQRELAFSISAIFWARGGSGADPSRRARKDRLSEEQSHMRGFGMTSREGECRGGWKESLASRRRGEEVWPKFPEAAW